MHVLYKKMTSCFCRMTIKTPKFRAVQVNSAGENLLHSAVKANDLESVLFLLGLQVELWALIRNAVLFGFYSPTQKSLIFCRNRPIRGAL
jgi:hypothetical protein